MARWRSWRGRPTPKISYTRDLPAVVAHKLRSPTRVALPGHDETSFAMPPKRSVPRAHGIEAAFAGLGDLTPRDRSAIQQAVDLLETATQEAEAIARDADGWLSRAKNVVTGIDSDTLVDSAKTMRGATESMKATAARLLTDGGTDHSRAVDFVRGAGQIASITQLKDSAARNSLVKLGQDVAADTVNDLKKGFNFSWPYVAGAAGGLAVLYVTIRAWAAGRR